MRHAWIAGALLLLAACSNKVTDSAVALTVEYPGYTPLCLRVTAADAAAPERRGEELITQSKLATDEDRTLVLAVYREKSWSPQLRIEVASYATADCTGKAIETRQLASAVTLPAKGSVPAALALLARDGDKDGHAAITLEDSAIQGTDCNDARGAVHPGAPAVCDGPENLGTDFDCDGAQECNGGGCASDAQCGSGFCVAGICCDSACETPSSQCHGAGTCGTGTCVYPVTPGVSCDDGNACTSGDTCSASGTCTSTATKTCDEPRGQCFAERGTCNTSTGECEYEPLPPTAACDDGKKCTEDRCDGSGTCVSTVKTCNTPPNTCREGTGTCDEASGECEYAPNSTTGPCEDGNKCTLGDRCNGSGTCVGGAAKTCDAPPSQCHVGTCNAASGSCNYEPKSSSSTCDDGKVCTSSDKCDGVGGCNGTLDCSWPTLCKKPVPVCTADGKCQFEVDPEQQGKLCREAGKTGTCQADGACQPLQFSYAVTGNFDPVALVSNPIGDLDISCGATFDSSATPGWTFAPGCSFAPPTHVETADGFVVIAVRHLTVNAPLRVVGSRPVILAVYGDATLNDELLAHSAREASRVGAGSGVGCSGRTGGPGGVGNDDGSGGGGGGLATEGGLGGANDDGTAAGGPKGGALTGGFSPLVGGCRGGTGGGIAGTTPGVGGQGGGALQLSVAGRLTLGSVVSVSGAGGGGGDATISNAAGGGGGGSGGMLVLEANSLVIESNARVTANGGAGGEGSDARGGSQSPGTPGADGSTQNDTPVAGGEGSAEYGGAGGTGAAGSTGPGDGVEGSPPSGGSNGAGGGGGGAAGRILLRGVTGCSSLPTGAIISPVTSLTCPP
jgi:hypothetical protein